MSSLSDTDPDLWDTISCSKCLLPFLSKAGPTIPFWLTECGHILCNNHLSKQPVATRHPFPRLTVPGPNQSCTQCGAQGIQLTPLQKEVATPSGFFDQDSSAHVFIDGSPDVRVVSTDHVGVGCSCLFRQGSTVTFERALSITETPCQFQQEMMAVQIMSLRSRCQQQRMIIDRLKTENSELKKYHPLALAILNLNMLSLQAQRRPKEWKSSPFQYRR